MSHDLGSAFTALIVIILIVQGLEILVDVLKSRASQKSESDEYESWKYNQEKMARWRATYDAERSEHGPKAPPYRTNSH